MQENINIVWIKRDIRSQDHASFFEAEKDSKPYLPIYIFEPSILKHTDSSLRHQQFVFHSLVDVNKQLEAFGREIIFQFITYFVSAKIIILLLRN